VIKFVEMDDQVTLRQQLSSDEGSVIVINKFNVRPDEVGQLVAAWTEDARFFKAQPGFISTQLHRGIGGSSVFVNYAVWESVEAFRNAFGRPEFQSAMARYPSSTVTSPHLFQKVAVPGVCIE